MTTFDGSSGPPASDRYQPHAPRYPEQLLEPAVEEAPFDALAALREQLDERTDENTCYVDVPGLGWRLVCDADFPYSQYARWQKASFPVSQRNRRKGPNLLDLDQAVLSRLVLLGTCRGMEFQDSHGQWQTLLTSSGAPMTPDSGEIMQRFNEVDPGAFLRRLFGTDAQVMRAGEKVLKAAGWMEDDGDEAEDPTV